MLQVILFIGLLGALYAVNYNRLDEYSKWYCSQVYKLSVNCEEVSK